MRNPLCFVSSFLNADTFNYRLFRTIERLLKYMVVICDLAMTLQCLILLSNGYSWMAEFFCGYSVFGFVAIFLSSYLLHFCWRYRACLFHSFAVNCCITYQREAGFGCMIDSMRWLMFLMGVVLIVLVVTNDIKQRRRSSE